MAEAILASSGIYAIRNKENGKVYIGSAVNTRKRWNNHRFQLRANCHHSKKLQNAWNKYGEDAFEFEIVEEILDKSLLIDAEQRWIDNTNSFYCGYNCRKNASSFLGMKQSSYFLEKMSRIMKGNKHGLGKKRTTEQLQRMVEISRGRHHSEETKEKLRAKITGKKKSEEAKRKISESLMGNKNTLGYQQNEETKRKVSISLIGNKRALGMRHTEEARKKMSETRKGRVLSAEVRAKMVEAQRTRREKELELCLQVIKEIIFTYAFPRVSRANADRK